MRDAALPGAELIDAGLADLADRTESDEALLVSMAALRLRTLGFVVPAAFPDAELRVGGTSAVLVDWRPSTIDIGLVMRPESDAMLWAISSPEERFRVNLEMASPDQFMPVPPGWEQRSPT